MEPVLSDSEVHNLLTSVLSGAVLSFFLLMFINFWLHWVFIAACRLSPVAASRWLLFVATHGLLTAVASPAMEDGLQGVQVLLVHGLSSVARRLQSVVSLVAVHRLHCPTSCGILLDQGPNSCPPRCKADSQLLDHQGDLRGAFFDVLLGTSPGMLGCLFSSIDVCSWKQSCRGSL